MDRSADHRPAGEEACSSTVIVRRAIPDDAPALARLRWRCRSAEGPTTEAEEAFLRRCAPWMAERLSSPDRWRCWVAVQEDRHLGCVWLEFLEKVPNPGPEPEEHAYVTALYVEPGERRAGTGGELLAKAVAECRRRGLDCALLWSTPTSRDLYLEQGFATDEEVLVLRDVSGPS